METAAVNQSEQERGDVKAGRVPWLWLLLGGSFLPFLQFQTVLPLAAWLAPVFLLRFTRRVRPAIAMPALAVVYFLGTLISLRGIFPLPGVYLFALPGILSLIPYGIDQWLSSRLRGFPRTLAFPLACLALDYLFGLSSLGTLGSPAYASFGDLPLTQLVSVTGIWGIVFLSSWLGPAANEVWEKGFSWKVTRYSLAPFAAVLLAVLVLGGLRVAFAPVPEETVRIAGLSEDHDLRLQMRIPPLAELAGARPEVRATARQGFTPVVDDLFARTAAQAQAGAKIVVWGEAAAFTLKEDEPALLARASELARQEGIYLQLGLVSVPQTEEYPFGENRAILFSPDGELVWDYFKAIHPLGDAAIFMPGSGTVPIVDTPFGRLGTVICFDADFPALIRQAGRARADILLVPAKDWQPVHVMHARAATFRAVENGFAMLRATGDGLSIAVDNRGRVLASGDDFVNGGMTMVAEVPTRGQLTLYTLIGDSLAYLSIIGVMALFVLAWFQGRSSRSKH